MIRSNLSESLYEILLIDTLGRPGTIKRISELTLDLPVHATNIDLSRRYDGEGLHFLTTKKAEAKRLYKILDDQGITLEVVEFDSLHPLGSVIKHN